MAKRVSVDRWLFAVTMLLVFVGLVMVFSASAVMARERFGSPYAFLSKQLIWAVENKRARWIGNKLVKIWDGHAWVSPEERFGEVRHRASDKADTERWDAEMPDAQGELARVLDTETLRGQLRHKVCAILDMASSDSTLSEIGEYLGFAGQYAAMMAGKEVRAAVAALNAAIGGDEQAAA